MSYASRWYKVDDPDSPALTIFHQANSSTFAAFQGTKFPLAEYAFLGFGLNGVDLADNATGTNSNGVAVPRSIVWDRRSGVFIGEESQTHDGRPVYRVVAEDSKRFRKVSARPGETTVIGGRRDFQNWHLWHVVIPKGEPRTARLELRDAAGKTTHVLHNSELTPGQHTLQLLFEDAEPEPDSTAKPHEKTRVVVLVDAKNIRKDRTEFKIPHIMVSEEATLKGHGNYITGVPPLRILEKQSTDQSQSLVWIIE